MENSRQSLKLDSVLTLLKTSQPELKKYRVKSLSVFGSIARGEADEQSDVDLLVEFEQTVGLLTFVRLQRYLETILGCEVDLGTPESLKAYLQEGVLEEAVRAF